MIVGCRHSVLHCLYVSLSAACECRYVFVIGDGSEKQLVNAQTIRRYSMRDIGVIDSRLAASCAAAAACWLQEIQSVVKLMPRLETGQYGSATGLLGLRVRVHDHCSVAIALSPYTSDSSPSMEAIKRWTTEMSQERCHSEVYDSLGSFVGWCNFCQTSYASLANQQI